MKTSELRKLIREEARKVIAENTNKSTKVNEGVFDSMMKALSQKVKLDGTILAKPEAKTPLQNLEKAVKGKPETFTAFTKMAKQMGVDLVKNMEKVKEAVVYAFIKGKFNNWIGGSYSGVYDPKTFEFSLVPASAGANALTSESQDSMQVALKRTIRETAKKKAVARKRRLNELTINPDPNDEMSGSAQWDFDAFTKKCPVVLTSEYEGDWMEENPNWDKDFIPLQNYLYAKYVDGVDFGLMIGMGDDIFNALAIRNPKILQDPTVKKYVKKAMSYGGLELEKGSI